MKASWAWLRPLSRVHNHPSSTLKEVSSRDAVSLGETVLPWRIYNPIDNLSKCLPAVIERNGSSRVKMFCQREIQSRSHTADHRTISYPEPAKLSKCFQRRVGAKRENWYSKNQLKQKQQEVLQIRKLDKNLSKWGCHTTMSWWIFLRKSRRGSPSASSWSDKFQILKKLSS